VDLCAIGIRQQLCAEKLGANRIDFCLFKDFALIVTADSHGKTEADDQSQQCERSALDYD
jgi:tartrate dehydratase beta subunit/fumarate hydratase class I family protein